ncbi:MAG: hypothetical protein K6E11_01275 [Bacilli bacterium]|nr:hypothetical protein [Bacilli bacterium]
MEEVAKVEKKPISKLAKAAKIIAIIAFALVMSALAGALVSDIVLFARQIIYFIVGCVGAVMAFIVGFFLFLISCILIFGIYLAESQGFWPVTWAQQIFTQVLNDGKLTPEEISVILIVRIILAVICFIVFVLSIVCLALKKRAKKKGEEDKQKLTKSFGTISLIFSILGLFAAVVMILLLQVFS